MFQWFKPSTVTLCLNEQLSWRKLSVRPTRIGLAMIVLAIAIWFGALNYAISLAYALSFWILSFLLISILMVRLQLLGLVVEQVKHSEVFAGEHVLLSFDFYSSANKGRSFYLQYEDQIEQVQIQGKGASSVTFKILTKKRGFQPLAMVTLYSMAPFGLMQTKVNIHLKERFLVYPAPVFHQPQLQDHLEKQDGLYQHQKGEDDLSYLVEHQQGQSLQRVSWKTFAKTGKLADKYFESEANVSPELISYLDYPTGLPSDDLASFLCHRVLAAEGKRQNYMLQLPEQTIDASPEQRILALTALSVM
ncbi:hypothetical protein [Neisseria sp. Ec49-e6-T10]|uniref:hypothetical protein n=1 Tax=Neisseria sp. Ec49-e6-T10 TaxID=3140744 RepID=UPI003EBA540F